MLHSKPDNYEQFSEKAKAFFEELDALCVKHDIVLSTCMYDNIHAGRANEAESAGIYCSIEDDTAQ